MVRRTLGSNPGCRSAQMENTVGRGRRTAARVPLRGSRIARDLAPRSQAGGSVVRPARGARSIRSRLSGAFPSGLARPRHAGGQGWRGLDRLRPRDPRSAAHQEAPKLRQRPADPRARNGARTSRFRKRVDDGRRRRGPNGGTGRRRFGFPARANGGVPRVTPPRAQRAQATRVIRERRRRRRRRRRARVPRPRRGGGDEWRSNTWRSSIRRGARRRRVDIADDCGVSSPEVSVSDQAQAKGAASCRRRRDGREARRGLRGGCRGVRRRGQSRRRGSPRPRVAGAAIFTRGGSPGSPPGPAACR